MRRSRDPLAQGLALVVAATLAAVASAVAATLVSAASAQSPWTLPEPGVCEPAAGGAGRLPDAPPLPFQPGDTITVQQLELLEAFVPAALFTYRDRFFYEGMRLEIGPCHADYGPPAFYREAGNAHGDAKLRPDGGLEDYSAGLPFAPERIAPEDPRAGLEWAWNFAQRYQGAGFRGPFRTVDMLGRDGRAEPFAGEIFKAQLSFRADRPADAYTAPGARGKHWVAGGVLHEPFDARHHAWRQYRDVAHLREPERSDDVHAYLPGYRRVRRLPGSGVEGLYMPAFSVGVVKATTLAGVGGGSEVGGVGSIGAAAGTLTTKRSGFEGLELRPLLYAWAVLGVRDLLAPINAASPCHPAPEAENRDFGPWGLSFASDRWDLRRALVLEGRRKGEAGGDHVSRLELTVDLQTLFPLYYVSWDSRGELIDVGMFVGRWSETRADYPPWPDATDRPVRVIDSVGEAFANVSEQGGWRRESWTLVSTPLPDGELKKVLSVNNLAKHH